MTNNKMPKRLYIPQPFAGGDSEGFIAAARTEIDTIAGDNLNFVDGFPSVYSSPQSQGGKPVTRADVNAIGHLASVNEYYYRCGGLNTFDPELAIKIGGYPRGAVLEGIVGLDYFRVVSLNDDNMVDFTGQASEDQVSRGVILGEVDGTNWAYCERGNVPDIGVVAGLPNFGWQGADIAHSDIFPIASFIAPRNGVIGVDGTYDFTATSTPVQGGTTTNAGGFGIVICPQDKTPFDIESGALAGKVFYTRGAWAAPVSESAYTSAQLTVINVVRGTRYGIYIVNVGGNVTNSEAKIVVR